MNKKVINTDGKLCAQNIYFMQKSKGRLFSDHGNPYSCNFRGKFLIAHNSIAAPDACYVLINTVEEHDKTFVSTDYDVLSPQPMPAELLATMNKRDLCSRPDFCVWSSYKCYSAKTKVGDIPILICKYRMYTGEDHKKIMDGVFYDAFMYVNDCLVTATVPRAYWEQIRHENAVDYAACDFYDFIEY